MPDYLPENGDPNWWNYGPWPPPLHQPSRGVTTAREGIIAEAATCYRLAGLRPSSEHDRLVSQMTELANHVTGFRYQDALRRLREVGKD